MLTVTQALRRRHSARAFLPTPVEKEVIEEILRTAARAPSGGNLQPWHVDVVTDAALAELKARAREQLAAGMGPTEYNIFPPDMAEVHIARRRRCGEDLYESIGIARGDKPARWAQFLKNYELFGAPCGLFFSLGREFDRPQWAHLGMYMQNIMLLAEEHGLATCAQEAWAVLHDTVADFIGLPPDRILYCGMALGHADTSHPINGYRTERSPLDAFVRFHG